MAMALLGLGLGFIRNIFGSGEDKLLGAIDDASLDNPASNLDPITSTNTVVVKKGKFEQLKIGLYNNDVTVDSPQYSFDVEGDRMGCPDDSGVTLSCPLELDVPLGESRGYGCVVNAAEDGVEGMYPCMIVAVPIGESGTILSQSFFVEVRQN